MLLLLKLSASLLICSCYAIGLADQPQQIDRLPITSKPLKYVLTLDIDLESMIFFGNIEINLEVLNETNAISLNSKDLMISYDTISLVDSFGKKNILRNWNESLFEVIVLNFDQLNRGNYILGIEFNGNITDNLKGLYRSTYFQNGELRTFATTFFAPNYARMVFPCYDEPGYRAIFDLTIGHSDKFHALSNSNKLRTIKMKLPNSKNKIFTTFEETLPMPAYTFAFIVSDLQENKNEFKNFSIFAQESVINDTNIALNFGQISLVTLEKYLNKNYQMQKMQFVAIDDFLMGAMENWGLITFHTPRLIYDSKKTSTKTYQQILKIITHELAHQWFGNEVTCSWFSHTWLNEGFATFMEDFITDLIHPGFELMKQFSVNTLQYALSLDSNADVRSMTNLVTNTDELSIIYNFVSYQKAASIIRMIENIVTPKIFQKIIQNYIKLNSMQSITPNELYTSFEENQENTDLNIREIFSNWADNPGYPVIMIERNLTLNRLEITQQRFLSTGPSELNIGDFIVPLNYATSHDRNFTETIITHWLQPDSIVYIDVNSSIDWVLFNKQQLGYYRVNYDINNWNSLIDELKFGSINSIHESNRAQLIDDSYNLAKYNYIPSSIPLSIMSYLRNEIAYTPFLAALPALDFYRTILGGSERHELIDEFIKSLVRPIFKVITNIEESKLDHISKLLRSETMKYACIFELPECLTYAVESYKNNINVDLRSSIYCGIAKIASDVKNNEIFVSIVDRIITILSTREMRQNNLQELNDIIDAIGCFTENNYIEYFLDMAYNQNFIFEIVDQERIFLSIFRSNNDNADEALNYLKNNYEKVKNVTQSIPNLIIKIGNGIFTKKLNEKFINILEENSEFLTFEDMAAVTIANKIIKQNLNWVEINEKEVFDWIENNLIEEPKPKPEPSIGNSNKSFIFLTFILCYVLLILM